MALERKLKVVWAVVGMEVVWPPFFMSKNGENSGWGYSWGYKVGLHFLKSGVTHSGFSGVG